MRLVLKYVDRTAHTVAVVPTEKASNFKTYFQSVEFKYGGAFPSIIGKLLAIFPFYENPTVYCHKAWRV